MQTTMDGGAAVPAAEIPPSAHMSLTYKDDFEAYAVDTPVVVQQRTLYVCVCVFVLCCEECNARSSCSTGTTQ